MFAELVKCATLLLALSAFYRLIVRFCDQDGLKKQLLSGCLFGGICVVGMIIPLEIAPGVIFDARPVILSTAGLFGGPVVGGLATTISAAYRLWIGGQGTVPGIGIMISSMFLGLLYRHFIHGKTAALGPIQLLVFGFIVNTTGIAWSALLPPEVTAKLMDAVAIPFVLTFTAATLLLGMLLKDIEHNHRLSKNLIDSEARLLQAQRTAHIGHWSRDLATGEIEWSDEVYRIFGLDPGTHIPRAENTESIIHPDDLEPFKAAINQISEHGGKHESDVRIINCTGITRWGRFKTERVDVGGDKALEICGTLQDITEHKNLEAELVRSQTTMQRTLLDLNNQKHVLDLHAVVATTDRKGNIVYANRMFCELSGYQHHEIIGQNHRMINSGHHSRAFYTNMWQTICAGNVWKGDLCNRAKDGSLYWVTTTIAPLRNCAGEIDQFIAIRTDITVRKKGEQKLLEQTEKAELANRAKDQFLAHMSHELRTPLNAILGFSSLINSQAFGPLHNERYKEYSQDIYRSGKFLLEIITDVLDVARIETGEAEPDVTEVIMPQILSSSIKMVTGSAKKKNISITQHVESDMSVIHADVRHMKQILLNLLTNAVNFTPDNGNVTIEAGEIDGFIVVQIIDTGIGIDAENLETIFEPFSQVRESSLHSCGGTGLGLSLSKKLTELNGGALKLASVVGVGTTATLSFQKPGLG